MLQIRNLETLTEKDIPNLLTKIQPILDKRKKLNNLYTRKADNIKVMYSDGQTNLPFEKIIIDLASGYLSGKPVYSVNTTNDKQTEIIKKIFKKLDKKENYVKDLNEIIKRIARYNDDETENYELIKDILKVGACYEIIYENMDNEVIYTRFDPLQTIAIYDYSTPANLIGFVRKWVEKDIVGNSSIMIELIDNKSTRVYNISQGKNETEMVAKLNGEKSGVHFWGDVPAICVETDIALVEACEDVIKAYEQLIQNVRNTYQYNDSDCKLKLTGYTPENPMLIKDEQSGKMIPNPDRIAEDKMWQNASTIYVGEGGDVSWLQKQLDTKGSIEMQKSYSDLIFQLATCPNASDLSFNNANLNTSAIDRKFYNLKIATMEVISKLKKEYLRRWEIILGRINLKHNTNFDFRDIIIDLPNNLPNNADEMITSMLKLKGTISEETIVEKLGYDYTTEKSNIDNETEDKIIKNIENMKLMRDSGEGDQINNSMFNHQDTSKKGVERDEQDNEMGQNRQQVNKVPDIS